MCRECAGITPVVQGVVKAGSWIAEGSGIEEPKRDYSIGIQGVYR